MVSKIRKISPKLIITLRIALMGLGGVFLLLLLLAFTSVPFWARYSLATSKALVPENTRSIVVMGGGGFPSESILIRLWYTLELAQKFPDVPLILATPGNVDDSSATIFQMRQYLLDHKIDSTRIILENAGLNTRHQALLVHDIFMQGKLDEPLVIITSPSHIYRSVKSFEKVGFSQVSGKPASSIVLETDLCIDNHLLMGKSYVPDSGNSISLRYTFWDYLKYEIEVIREYVAIVYYKLQGWI